MQNQIALHALVLFALPSDVIVWWWWLCLGHLIRYNADMGAAMADRDQSLITSLHSRGLLQFMDSPAPELEPYAVPTVT